MNDLSAPIAKPATAPSPGLISETNAAGFMAAVIEASRSRLILALFRSPRSQVSETLAATLEKIVVAERGAAQLVKINVDENPSLVGSLRIQAIPTVYAFFDGQVVDGFAGALPESQIRPWVQKLIKATASQPDDQGAADIESGLKDAQTFFDQGDIGTAMAVYDALLAHAPQEPRAFAGRLRCLIAQGKTAQAEEELAAANPEVAKNKALDPIRAALDMAAEAANKAGDAAKLEEKVRTNPNDHQARFDLALALYAAQKKEEATDALLEIVARDRKWNDDAARKQLVKIFEALGPTDPLTVAARKRLSSILFS